MATDYKSTPTGTLVDRAVVGLRDEILEGRLAPGERVHLTEAAERLGMSVVPVREALRALAAEGWVVAYPQRGYRVAELSAEDFADTCRLRLTLDPLATELAAARMGSRELERLADALEDLFDAFGAGDQERYALAHQRFHFAIYEASGSAWLVRFIRMLWEHTARYQRLQVHREGLLEQRLEEHRAIRDACVAGDATRAAELMRAHLDAAFRSAPTPTTEP
jgi:DNA-binding GntR family transcriptional regulator